jgi:hypothetical protein
MTGESARLTLPLRQPGAKVAKVGSGKFAVAYALEVLGPTFREALAAA